MKYITQSSECTR